MEMNNLNNLTWGKGDVNKKQNNDFSPQLANIVFTMIIIVFGEGVVKAIKMTNEWKTLHIRRAFNAVYFFCKFNIAVGTAMIASNFVDSRHISVR